MDTIEWVFLIAIFLGVQMVMAPGFFLWLLKRVRSQGDAVHPDNEADPK